MRPWADPKPGTVPSAVCNSRPSCSEWERPSKSLYNGNEVPAGKSPVPGQPANEMRRGESCYRCDAHTSHVQGVSVMFTQDYIYAGAFQEGRRRARKVAAGIVVACPRLPVACPRLPVPDFLSPTSCLRLRRLRLVRSTSTDDPNHKWPRIGGDFTPRSHHSDQEGMGRRLQGGTHYGVFLILLSFCYVAA